MQRSRANTRSRIVELVVFPLVALSALACSADESHWAFAPVARPPRPAVQNTSWPQHPLDRFVLARLEDAGMTPSPRADRRTLIRRAYFDLIGLPPTFEAVQQFASDDSPDAFARLVDDLLDRPEYGQRWGRHWLDVARYADTKGYIDGGLSLLPFAHTYRDYVIRSFNEDTPFNDFILEQLAADQLELAPRERWKLSAMGYLTVGPIYNSNPHDVIDDRIDVITRGFLGLTVSCARCHDHKFDPIPTTDYYALYGVLASSRQPEYPYLPRVGPSRGSLPEYLEYRETLRSRKRAYEEARDELHAAMQFEMRAFAGDYLEYLVQLMPQHRTRTDISRQTQRTVLRGQTPYAAGGIERWRQYIESRADDDPVFGLFNQLAALPAGDFAAKAGPLIDAHRTLNEKLRASFQERPPASMVDVAAVYGQRLEQAYHAFEELRGDSGSDFSWTAVEDPAEAELLEVLYGQESPCVIALEDSFDLWHLEEYSRIQSLRGAMEEVFADWHDVAVPRAMILVDRSEPVQARVFVRGNPNRKGEPVPRRFLSSLDRVASGPFEHGSGRLELAQAIASDENPLTPRVIVNRVWAWHFGTPLVDTPSDFGTRGAPPSHPELLDWLASEFLRRGWSITELHRMLMNSATYQQASRDRPEGLSIDPENRLLWRMNRRRLEFEAFRDSLLSVAGILDVELGGRTSEGFLSPRRSVYLAIDRFHVPPERRAFDFPSPSISCPERSETTIPQQALFLMNSEQLIEVAEHTVAAMRDVFDEGAAQDPCIQWLFRRVLSRSPQPRELEIARSFCTALSTAQVDAPENSQAPADGWVQLAMVLLQSNEFTFVD